MPHRMRRRDKRREWMLAAIRLLYDDIDADEQLMGMTVATRDSGGVMMVHGIEAGGVVVVKAIVADENALKASTASGVVVIPRLLKGTQEKEGRKEKEENGRRNSERRQRSSGKCGAAAGRQDGGYRE